MQKGLQCITAWGCICIVGGCIIFILMTIVHVLPGTPQNILIKRGTGTYKLHNPNGTKKGIISWSQYGQDQLIDKLLNQKRNGFFVEIGGFDGETFSNSLFLEK